MKSVRGRGGHCGDFSKFVGQSDIDKMVTVAALLSMFNKYSDKKGCFIHPKLIHHSRFR